MKRTLRTLLALTLVLGLMAGLMSVAEAKTATRITMSRRTLSMDWGTRYTLAVTVTPTNASDKSTIVWNSSDPALIQVQADASSRKALVTVRGKASLDEPYPLTPVVITATTSMGKTTTCTITLKQIDVKSISVSPSSKTVYLTKSQPTYQMPKPTFNPSLAGDQVSYTWSTGNAAVATVDAATGLVTFTGEGTARITATYTSGVVTASDFCTFVVKPIRVKSISLDKTTLYMGQGESFQLTGKLISAVSGKIPSYDKITWSSADESIAKVDKDDGTITAQGKSGIVKITATVDKAPYTKSASCMVYVRENNPTRVTITAAGDCVLGGDPRTTGITARSTQRNYERIIAANGDLYPFEKVAKLFAPIGGTGRTNLSIVNLEVSLTTKGGSNPNTERKFLFRGSPANAKALDVGIDIANIANNHTADFGSASFTNTASSVERYSAAQASGYNRSAGDYTPTITVDGKKIGFYGFQAIQMPLSMLESRIKKIKNDKQLDMLVVTIHWTGQKEHVRPVNATMRAYARKAIDSGADLVIGHHRHQVSGIEYYKGKYIVYDMGNFVTGGGDSPYTYAVQVDFDISGAFAESAADGIRIYPIYTTSEALYTWNSKSKSYSVKQSNNWQPVPANEAIHHLDKDNLNAPVYDLNVVAEVRNIINGNSPKGPDGQFNATNYMRDYSDLP